jgi:hypothetical protein
MLAQRLRKTSPYALYAGKRVVDAARAITLRGFWPETPRRLPLARCRTVVFLLKATIIWEFCGMPDNGCTFDSHTYDDG